jgi:hypothetical protein
VAGQGYNVGAGGLVKDHHGTWIKRFSCKRGFVSIKYAELFSIRLGI